MISLEALAASGLADKFGPTRFNPLEDLVSGLFGSALACIFIALVVRAYGKVTNQQSASDEPTAPARLSDAYKRKLVHWMVSAITLVTATVLGVCMVWFVYFPALESRGFGNSIEVQMAGPLAESLLIYAFAFIPTLIWHLADFQERESPKGIWLAFLSSHAVFSAILICASLTLVLICTGWFTVERPCGFSFVVLFESCVGQAPILGLPTRLLLFILLSISLLKLAVSLRSRLGRPQ